MVTAVASVELSDAGLAASIADGLVRVEAALAEAAESEEALLSQTSRHLMDAGGKRFRAMLVLLAAQFGEHSGERVIKASTAIELIHLATLYHDDVMDEALVRRSTPSANARWTNTIAILTGDFLFARASQLLADLGDEAVRIQAETFARLVSGQVAETIGPRPGEDPLAHHLRVVEDKAASLMATAGRFGTMFSGAPPDVVARMTSACHALGVAFQLSDDILDVASESEQSGKTPGTDLREGIRSLPVLHALRSPGPGGGRLRDLLSSGGLTDESLHAEALLLLREHPAMAAARADLRRWSERARDQIMGLPAVPARVALVEVCEYMIGRSG